MARPSKLHLHRGQWRTRIAGVEYTFGPDKRKATHEFHKLKARATRKDADTTGAPANVSEVIERFLILNTAECVPRWLKLFHQFAGRTYLDEIGRDFLTRYLIRVREHRALRPAYDKASKSWSAKPTDRALSPKTVKHYVAIAAEVLRWAHGQGWLAGMPEVPKHRKAKRKARDLTRTRLRDALAVLPDRAGRILKFIAYTGCRPAEACGLRWEHVRLDLGVAVLTEHKTAESTGEPRTIYFTPEAADILRGMAPGQGFVFTSRLGTPYTSAGLRSILRRHSDGATPYQLRHTFAQSAVDAGVHIDDLAKLMGHADEATTKFYAGVRDGRAVEIASRIRMLPAAG